MPLCRFLINFTLYALITVLSHFSQHHAHAGPTGKVLLLPEDPNAVIIMVATGTGAGLSAWSNMHSVAQLLF